MLALVLPALVLFLLYAIPHYWLRLSRAARLTAHLPGPKPLPLVGNALEFGKDTVSIQKTFEKFWREHGTLFRMWLGPTLFLFVTDPKYVEHFLNSNENISKNMTYKFVEPWLGKGLLTSTGSKWKHHRKIITPTFHFKILENYLEVFNSQGNTLIEKLKKKTGGSEFNIYDDITICALDIICESAMGTKMDLQNNSNSEYVLAVKGLADVSMKRTIKPWFYPDFIFNAVSLGRRQRKYLKIVHNTTNEVIKRRKKELLEDRKENIDNNDKDDFGQKKRMAFLDLLLVYKKDGANLTDVEIREEVDTFMFEGHDTTASGMGFCLWMLAKHQNIQDKAYEELVGIFGDSDRDATSQDLQDMKYLERVIKETQRILPSVPHFARELDVDAKIDDLHVASGTNILISPFFIHRNPEYFPDPEKFDPDRFLPDVAQGRNPYAYIPFSAGPRNCIGQKFAMMEMKSTISKIIRNFRVLPGSKEITLSAELVLRSWEGIFVKLELRK